jgi:hypothetical protein
MNKWDNLNQPIYTCFDLFVDKILKDLITDIMDLSYIATKPKGVQRPRTLVCYICGREYGTRSLEIHLKTCEKKWDVEQAKLPKKKQKPCP